MAFDGCMTSTSLGKNDILTAYSPQQGPGRWGSLRGESLRGEGGAGGQQNTWGSGQQDLMERDYLAQC